MASFSAASTAASDFPRESSCGGAGMATAAGAGALPRARVVVLVALGAAAFFGRLGDGFFGVAADFLVAFLPCLAALGLGVVADDLAVVTLLLRGMMHLLRC